jgi:aerobic-type carbon monoxide dehydrogenase small subunit (CoxS/CutS family)
MLRLVVNGIERLLDVSPELTLLSVLRDDLGLTGARYGCGHGVCGACYVLVAGEAMAACTMRAEDVGHRDITTIEGVARCDGVLHPAQQAFIDLDAMQCGYCTSGMIISAAALLRRNRRPNDKDIRTALASHLCRCGIYIRAIAAVKKAAEGMT